MKKIQLIRFFDSEKWANEFCKGNISMNYLGAYWGPDLDKLREEKEREKWESKEITPAKYGQDDFYEGTVVVKGKDCAELPDELRKRIVGNAIFRVEAYRYCNLLCMCVVDYDDESRKINLPDTEYFKKNFGRYAVIIRDTDEFLKRINTCMSLSSYDYIYGRVNYTNIIGDYSVTEHHSVQLQSDLLTTGLQKVMDSGRLLDVFDKDKLLRQQKEWRLCVYRGIREEQRYEPDPKLDTLTDISEVVLTDEVNKTLYRQHIGYTFGFVQHDKKENYYGNISQEALQRKICEDGRYKMLLNIGER